MSILNYTTKIPIEKTVGEIQALLARARASSIITNLDSVGVMSAIGFRINTKFGVLTYCLPANIDKVEAVLVRNARIPKKLRNRAQAARVAWRIVKDWLEAQLAFIEAEQVDLEQVFLAYMQRPDGSTVYEAMRDQNFKGLALPEKSTT